MKSPSLKKLYTIFNIFNLLVWSENDYKNIFLSHGCLFSEQLDSYAMRMFVFCVHHTVPTDIIIAFWLGRQGKPKSLLINPMCANITHASKTVNRL
jgi:hypothetical protein